MYGVSRLCMSPAKTCHERRQYLGRESSCTWHGLQTPRPGRCRISGRLAELGQAAVTVLP